MIPINIDVSDVIQEFSLMSQESDILKNTIVDGIVAEYLSKWEDLVNGTLKSTRTEYKKAIFVKKEDDGSVVIGMTPTQSQLGLMIEDGAPAYDMKVGFAKSSKKKSKKDGGWYLTVPFRYATSDALAESSIFAGKLPKKVQEASIRQGGEALKKSDLPKEYQVTKTSLPLNIGGRVTKPYQQKSPIYEGLKKLDIGAPGEKRSGYFTFRRVSDKSDEDSWIHKGFKGEKLMDKAMNSINIESIVDMAIDKFLGNR